MEERPPYVKVRDLVVGEFYYVETAWRNTFVYLGRNDNKDFVWYYIEFGDDILKNPMYNTIHDNIHRLGEEYLFVTKRNMKVRLLKNAHKDEKAFLWYYAEKLIQKDVRIILTDADQEKLQEIMKISCYDEDYRMLALKTLRYERSK